MVIPIFKPDFHIFPYNEQLGKSLKNFIDKFLLYHTSLKQDVFDKAFFQLEYSRLTAEQIWTCYFLENNTSWEGLLGSGLKSIFQIKAHFEINIRSLWRVLALSFLSLTNVKRDVSSAKSFRVDFNSLGNSLM